MTAPQIPESSMPLMPERLSTRTYDADDCLAAIRGERVPSSLGLALTRLCVIRGIRYHPGFAKDLYGTLAQFTRALNARMIMSNIIPEMDKEEDIPYCIWHPVVASESTYRLLVQRYPNMAYQVARACAVAGYTSLYLELDILPDVHIAEEARECGNVTILDHIMAAPARYTVMNDYNRSIKRQAPKADLNGDTAVHWMLDIKQRFHTPEVNDDDEDDFFYYNGFTENYFNITEDMNIDEVEVDDLSGIKPSYDVMSLLSSPLPIHLPTVDKDLLILMAAYYGDIDRYVRLRRPMMIGKEINCCVHGIYHHTLFAVWWSKQSSNHPRILQAIKGRFIMNNVLAPINPKDGLQTLPTLISYPTVAKTSTYRALAKYNPGMVPRILRVCIEENIIDLFNELILKIDKSGLEEVLRMQKVERPHFLEAVEKRLKELGCTPGLEGRLRQSPQRNLACSTEDIPPYVGVGLVQTSFSSNWSEDYMNGLQCDVSEVELLACLPDEWKHPGIEQGLVQLDYIGWPPSWGVSGLSL